MINSNSTKGQWNIGLLLLPVSIPSSRLRDSDPHHLRSFLGCWLQRAPLHTWDHCFAPCLSPWPLSWREFHPACLHLSPEWPAPAWGGKLCSGVGQSWACCLASVSPSVKPGRWWPLLMAVVRMNWMCLKLRYRTRLQELLMAGGCWHSERQRGPGACCLPPHLLETETACPCVRPATGPAPWPLQSEMHSTITTPQLPQDLCGSWGRNAS